LAVAFVLWFGRSIALATLTATETASVQPLLERPAIGLLADPVSVRRLELVLGGSFAVVARGHDAESLAVAAVDVAVVVGTASLFSRGGIVSELRGLPSPPPIVVVSKCDERALVGKALRAGVNGFVSESRIEVTLAPTITAVIRGQLSIPQTIRHRVPWRTLSLREQQVLQLVARGLTNGEIADRLYLSESTVKSHLSSSFRKLGVSSRAEAAAVVLDPEHGLLSSATLPPALISLEQALFGSPA
jgi:DNA-binding NarL/FixJ family response regulator